MVWSRRYESSNNKVNKGLRTQGLQGLGLKEPFLREPLKEPKRKPKPLRDPGVPAEKRMRHVRGA